MLVLSRKLSESIVVNESITITVLELSRGRVRLGIAAPANVPVHRHELVAGLKEPLVAPLEPRSNPVVPPAVSA